jgi:alcohol dehydrogenase class IV
MAGSLPRRALSDPVPSPQSQARDWNSVVNAQRQQDLLQAMAAPQRPAHELVAELVRHLEQPGTLRAVNIQRANFDVIASRALTYGPVRANPRPIKSTDEVKEILELAW